MRRALPRQWTSTLIVRRSQSSAGPKRSHLDEIWSATATSSKGESNIVQHVGKEQKNSTPGSSKRTESLESEPLEVNVPIRKLVSVSLRDFAIGPQIWDGQMSELAKSQGTDKSALQGGFNFPKNAQDLEVWSRFLEAVRAQRRHVGPAGTWALYLSMIKSKLDMPTEGKEAGELWAHFVHAGSDPSKNLSIMAEYAIGLHQRTGKARPGFYRETVGNQLLRYPYQALELHQSLKAHFPPDREDYEALLRLSLHAGQESFRVLEEIYTDHPVSDLYQVVVPELCKREMRTEATNWHFMLVERGDLPKTFNDCKLLFRHYTHIKNDKVVEALIKSLIQRQVKFEKDVTSFVRKDKFISREIMNRALGEAHNIPPKSLSDGFCARLFATKFFSVAMIVSGLQIMGLQSLGPSSLREIVVRDRCHCETVMRNITMVREGGITLQQCRYNTIIEKAAFAGQKELLTSMTSTDLHPDTFEDDDLQERLLAMYYKMGDNGQVARTLAVFQSTTPETWWDTHRANLLLRCHISLRNRPEVRSILMSMQRNNYPLAPRSSRHLRTVFLPPRRHGVQPSSSRQSLEDIILVINVMRMSLHAGYSMPIEAWKEILKRLGMMGHLNRYEGLALWLVNWYSQPLGPESLLGLSSTSIEADRKTSLMSCIPTKSLNHWELVGHKTPLTFTSSAHIQNQDLLKLFGKDAQQGMIAWGFLAEVKRRPNLSRPRKNRYPDPQTHWQWGLRLLKELQLRGVPVNRRIVARACKLRLAQLFNIHRISQRILNRRARALNDERSKFGAKFRYGAYVKGMEEIWGRHLFRSGYMTRIL